MKSLETTDQYLLESYKYKSRYLAFETHKESGVDKLVLRTENEDQVDEAFQLRFLSS